MNKGSFRLSSRGVKASLAYLIASLISKGIIYVTTPIFTRLLTSDEYGKTSIYMTWVQVLGTIAMFSLSYGVFNNGMIDYPEKRDEYSLSMLGLSNVITVISFVILLLLYPVIKPLLNIDIPLILLMFTLFFFQPAYSFWFHRQRFELKYKWTVFWSILCGILSPLAAIILIILNKSESNLYPRIFGAEGSLIIVYIGFYIYLFYKGNWKIEKKYWKAAFLFNLPLIPHYLSTYLLNSSDRIMISFLVSDSETAYYSVAYTMSAVALVFWTAINGSLIPYTYEKCKIKDYKSINDITIPILFAFATVCVIVIMFAPEAVMLMATSEYREAIYVIPPILGGVFFQVQYYIYANILYYYKKPQYVMIGSVTAVMLNLVLNYIFISKYGYAAAGYTTLFCYGLQAVIDYIGLRIAVKKRIYDMKLIFILSCAVIGISLSCIGLYDKPAWIRYCIIVTVCCIAFYFRKTLKLLWIKLRNR